MSGRSCNSRAGTILLVLPVGVARGDGGLMFEPQACNGLRLWSENFERVTVACPVLNAKPAGYLPVSDIPGVERITFVPLPYAYRLDHFATKLPSVVRSLRQHIAGSRYLSFAVGGMFGDWASVAAIVARRMGRKYSVWTDRVESAVAWSDATNVTGLRGMYRRTVAHLMKPYERYIIRQAEVGLFHGRDCFEAYSAISRNPYCVHDIHLSAENQIGSSDLVLKAACALNDGPLRIAYVGRAVSMKGPMDWLTVLSILRERGIPFEATWAGDGELLPEMRRRIDEQRLFFVQLAGNLDRPEVLRLLGSANLFMFCHKTPESPRCLIEALMRGCPIVGYRSSYPEDLTAKNGGGIFVGRDDVQGLANAVAELHGNRARLAELTRYAAESGKLYSDDAVFRHRSELIKRHLS